MYHYVFRSNYILELLNKNTIRYLLYENQFTSYIDTMWNLNKSFGRTYSYKGNIIIPIYENYVVKYSIERENYFKVIIDKSKLKLNPLDKNKKDMININILLIKIIISIDLLNIIK